MPLSHGRIHFDFPSRRRRRPLPLYKQNYSSNAYWNWASFFANIFAFIFIECVCRSYTLIVIVSATIIYQCALRLWSCRRDEQDEFRCCTTIVVCAHRPLTIHSTFDVCVRVRVCLSVVSVRLGKHVRAFQSSSFDVRFVFSLHSSMPHTFTRIICYTLKMTRNLRGSHTLYLFIRCRCGCRCIVETFYRFLFLLWLNEWCKHEVLRAQFKLKTKYTSIHRLSSHNG